MIPYRVSEHPSARAFADEGTRGLRAVRCAGAGRPRAPAQDRAGGAAGARRPRSAAGRDSRCVRPATMNRWVGLAILLLNLGAGAQCDFSRSSSFLRSTIETYPEAERRPILDYLDRARVETD